MNESTLLDRINNDLKEAMRQRNETAKLTLRSIKSAILEAEKSGKFDQGLTDDDIMQIVAKTAKQRRDAIIEYERAERTELAASEKAELAIIEDYLPKQLSAAQIEVIVREVIAETGAQSMRDMNKVMPVAMERVAGQADGRAVNQVVRQLLG